jgi:hypothetical protein
MGLAAVAQRLEPAEAARLLNQALAQQKDGNARTLLGTGLAAVVGRLEPAEAARMCAEAARSYNQALDQSPDRYAWPFVAERVSTLLQPVEGESGAHAARAFALRMVSDPDNCGIEYGGGFIGELIAVGFNPKILDRFLTDGTRPPVQRRAVAITVATGASAQGPLLPLALLPTADEPLPCRLTTQELVELLKMPTCVGPVRRLILDQLGNRYGRRFETQWDFVRYAGEQGLDLDFATPPQRPDRRLPPLFAE